MAATFSLVFIGIAGLFYLGRFAEARIKGYFGTNREIRRQVIYQSLLFPFALLLLFLNRVLNTKNIDVLSFGTLDAKSNGLEFMGFTPNAKWSEVGVTFLIVPLLVTIIVVYFQLIKGKQVEWRFFPKALAFSLIFSVFNSLSEEIIFRIIPIEGLSAYTSAGTIALLCALWFGIPHYFGNPGKVPGVLMAGFLGWIAAKSIIDTQGILWAWGIHFVLDVPIVAFMILSAQKTQSK